jgi:hypothetical protein
MRATPRRSLSYASFVFLLALDAVTLISLLLDQILGAPLLVAWLAAAVVTAFAAPALLRVTDKLFAMAGSGPTIPQTGESFL